MVRVSELVFFILRRATPLAGRWTTTCSRSPPTSADPSSRPPKRSVRIVSPDLLTDWDTSHLLKLSTTRYDVYFATHLGILACLERLPQQDASYFVLSTFSHSFHPQFLAPSFSGEERVRAAVVRGHLGGQDGHPAARRRTGHAPRLRLPQGTTHI